MSFGRKGLIEAPRLTPGQAMALRAAPPPAPHVEPQGGAMSPELAAFLAAERSNGSGQPGLSDIALARQGSSVRSSVNADSPGTVIVHKGERLMIIAYVLWWFCAPLGAHRHYLGAHTSGFAQMAVWITSFVAMLGGASSNSTAIVLLGIALMVGAIIWFFADAFLIPAILRRYNERPNAETFT